MVHLLFIAFTVMFIDLLNSLVLSIRRISNYLCIGVLIVLVLLLLGCSSLEYLAEEHVLVGTHLVLGDIGPACVGAERG